jgi:hypothetical protein
MHRAIAALFAAALLTACAVEPSVDSPHYALPTGSRLVLEKAIRIPGDRVSVYIQRGEPTSYGGRDRYNPYCKLEMWSRSEAARTVEPDTFRIERVVRNSEYVALPVGGGLRRVAAEPDDGGGPMAYVMETVMYLASERQPDVYRLGCAHWDQPSFPQHLTIREIEAALAGLFRLELPPPLGPS